MFFPHRPRPMTAALIMKGLVKLAEGTSWMAHSRQAGAQTEMRGNFHRRKGIMDIQEQNERGLKLRVDMFGREAVDKRMNAFGDFGKPCQQLINAYVYGDVWQRPSLPPSIKSLVMVAMMGAAGH